MFCENCGSAIPKGKNVCEHCGRLISKNQSLIKKELEEKEEWKRLSSQFGVDNKIEYRDTKTHNIKLYIILAIIITIIFLIILKAGG